MLKIYTRYTKHIPTVTFYLESYNIKSKSIHVQRKNDVLQRSHSKPFFIECENTTV